MIQALHKDQCIDNRYIIIQRLGAGRTSEVYEALDKKTGTSVALKVLDPMIVQDAVHIERFRREAKVLRHVKDAQVIQVYEVVESQDLKYLVLEKFDGVDLKTWIQNEGCLSLERFHGVIAQILKTISICHGHQVIHRDIKPHNIMIGADYNIKVVDFGISRMTAMSDLTKTGTILGTPEYLAPECFSSSNTDLRQDIYSLGCVMYEMLIGHPPFGGDNLQQVFQKKLRGEYVDPSVVNGQIPKFIGEIIAKCLEIDVNRRYQNVSEIFEDLQKNSLKTRALPPAEQVKCLNCNTVHIPGADFCYHCGKYSVDIFEDGIYSVVITRCERKDVVLRYIHRNYPFVSKDHLVSKFTHIPLLIARNISETSAQLIQNELSVMPLECIITKNLPTEFQLPKSYFALALMMLGPVFLLQQSFLLQCVAMVVVETILFGFYRLRTLPVINHKAMKARIKKDLDVFWLQSLQNIARVEDQKVQAILGHMLYRYSQFSSAQKSKLADPLTRIFALGLRSNELYSSLKGSQVIQIQKKLEIVTLQIKNETVVEKIDSLIKVKAELTQEHRAYRKLMEAYGDFYNFLLCQLEDLSHFDGVELHGFELEKIELFNLENIETTTSDLVPSLSLVA